jgi:transposase-like protein
MSDKQYRTYTKEFKLEALRLLESSGKSGGQLERELGITPGLLLNMARAMAARTRESAWNPAT